jgi:hypothetical protein
MYSFHIIVVVVVIRRQFIKDIVYITNLVMISRFIFPIDMMVMTTSGNDMVVDICDVIRLVMDAFKMSSNTYIQALSLDDI